MVLPMFALGVAQTGLNIYQGKKNAAAQNKYAKEHEALVGKLADMDAIQSYAALSARRSQERRLTLESLDHVTLEARRRLGTLTVASGESGVHGNSSAALVDDFLRVQLQTEQNVLDSEKFANDQFTRDVEAVRSQQIGRLYDGQMSRDSGPNYVQELLNLTAVWLQNKGAEDRLAPKGDIPGASPRIPLDLSGLQGLQF